MESVGGGPVYDSRRNTHLVYATMNPLKVLRKFGWIALLSVLVGAVLPGLVAFHEGVFFRDQTEQRVRSRRADADKVLEAFDKQTARINLEISVLDGKIAAAGPGDNAVPALISLRQADRLQLEKKLAISIQPFYLHVLMYFWPVMYCGLSTVIFILRPSGAQRSLRSTLRAPTLLLALGIFVGFVVPFVFRVFAAPSFAQGRTVYAYCNPDISLVSFLIQLLNFVLMCLLLAVIWTEWSEFASEQRVALLQASEEAPAADFRLLSELSRQFFRWQVTFLAISVGFATYTGVFWTQIVRNGDKRFWYEAIAAHGIWVITIVLTATTLGVTWNTWRRHKLRIITDLINQPHPPADGFDARITLIRGLGAVSNWNVVFSIATIITTLLVPLIQAFIK